MVSELPSPEVKKTDAEQVLLKNLQELETELAETASSERKKQLSDQISLLNSELLKLQGKGYGELVEENTVLRAKVKELEEKHRELQVKCREVVGKTQLSESDESNALRLRLYRLLLNKFSSLINESGKKTVGEIKALVSDEDLSIQSLLSKFKPQNYDLDNNYFEVAEKLFEFVSKEFSFVKADLDVNFWLTPAELLKEKLGDDEDLAIFLCSCFYSLGDMKAEVVIAELDDLSSHAFVVTSRKDKFLLLDSSQKHSFYEFSGAKEAVLKKYSFQGAKIKRFLCRFNHFSYELF